MVVLPHLCPLGVRGAKAGNEVRAVVPAVVGDDGGQLPERPGVGLHGQSFLARGVRHLNGWSVRRRVISDMKP